MCGVSNIYVYIIYMFWAADMIADEVVHKMDNQINFDNFVVGAMKLGILKNKNISIEDTYENKGRYMHLYDGLVEIGIIKSELSISTLQTGFYKYTVTTQSELLEPNALKTKCSTNNKINGMLENGNYIIDYNKLSSYLKGYSYKTVDQVKVLIQTPPVRKSLVQKPPVRKSLVQKPPVRKPPVRKPLVRKPPVRKPLVRKSMHKKKGGKRCKTRRLPKK
jgi:hypothetical protein